jgi:hypothetical protein
MFASQLDPGLIQVLIGVLGMLAASAIVAA